MPEKRLSRRAGYKTLLKAAAVLAGLLAAFLAILAASGCAPTAEEFAALTPAQAQTRRHGEGGQSTSQPIHQSTVRSLA